MNLETKIDRVLTEYNFDRMSFDDAKQTLLDLHSEILQSAERFATNYKTLVYNDTMYNRIERKAYDDGVFQITRIIKSNIDGE